MKIIIFILFIVVNFINLKIIQPKIPPKKALKYLCLMLVLVILCAMFISFFKQETSTNNISFLFYVSIVILIFISIANQISHLIINNVIIFHKRNNVKNLNRNPIKFLINYQETVKKVVTIIWIINSTVILMGLWFGKNN